MHDNLLLAYTALLAGRHLQAPSPGVGIASVGIVLDLAHLKQSGDRQAAGVVMQSMCERALLFGDATAADELVAASHTLRPAGGDLGGHLGAAGSAAVGL